MTNIDSLSQTQAANAARIAAQQLNGQQVNSGSAVIGNRGVEWILPANVNIAPGDRQKIALAANQDLLQEITSEAAAVNSGNKRISKERYDAATSALHNMMWKLRESDPSLAAKAEHAQLDLDIAYKSQELRDAEGTSADMTAQASAVATKSKLYPGSVSDFELRSMHLAANQWSGRVDSLKEELTALNEYRSQRFPAQSD